jgi:hypothetical protein
VEAAVTREVFRLGDAADVIEPERIERELTAMWRAASRDPGAPVVRACAMTLVVLAGPEGPEERQLEVAVHHPARVLALIPDEDDADRLDATASALCRRRAGGRVVCCEEVRVRYGEAARPHLPSLVRALGVGDLPVVVLALDPAADPDLAERLRPDADVVLLAGDAGTDGDAESLAETIREELRRARCVTGG